MKKGLVWGMVLLLAALQLSACTLAAGGSSIRMDEEKMSLSAVAVEGVLYVMGGIAETGEFLDTCQAYDTALGAWTELAAMPIGRAGAAAAYADGRIYLFGGRGPDGTIILRVDAYDIASGQWESAGDMPYEAWNAAAECCDGVVYVMGGIRGTGDAREALADTFLFHPETMGWERGPALPAPRHDAASAVMDGRIYLIGGKEETGSSAPAIDRVSVLDLETMQWSEAASLPTPRVGMRGGAIDGKIYVAGGNYSGEVLDSVESYEPETDVWTTAGRLSYARMSHAAAVSGGVLYVVGGSLTIPASASDICLTDTVEAVIFNAEGT